MIGELLQSTAIDYPFVLVDSSGAPVTGKVSGDFTKRISKNSGAFGSMTVTITELESGWYNAAITSSHTDTAGVLSITFSATGALNAYLQWRVVANITIPSAAENADAVHDEDSGKLRAHIKTALKVIVGTGSTTTTVVLDPSTGIDGAAPSALNDYYNNQTFKVTSGALAGVRVDVTDYDGASKTLTVTAMPAGLAAGVTGILS